MFMATLDEFIDQNLRPSERDVPYGVDFRNCGGYAVMITPDGKYSAHRLGILNAIVEFLDNPKFSAASESFEQGLLQVERMEPFLIFKGNDVMREAVSYGLLALSPKEGSYERIKGAVDDLYSKFQAFQDALPEKRKSNHGIKDIRARIEKIKGAETPKETMRLISEESNELAQEVVSYIPSWVERVWHLKMPDEYNTLKSAYDTLRDACRSVNYWVHVPEGLKQNTFLKKVDVNRVPVDRQGLFITDTPDELKALAGIFSEETDFHQNILYRGPVNDNIQPAIDALRKSNHFVVCEQIQGPAQYREWLEGN
jgi:hypothetical protein